METVLIIEAEMKAYRASFYSKLHQALERDGIRLKVAYSPSKRGTYTDTCDLPATYGYKVRSFWLWRKRLLYQSVLRLALGSDFVIIDQGNRFLVNHLLLPLSRLNFHPVAFWGHGQNFQDGKVKLSEWYRKKTLNWVSWWFAYTRGTAEYLVLNGVPREKITAVQNALDSREQRECVESLTANDRASLRSKVGIPVDARVGVFCGTLSETKGLPFLINSSELIASRVAGFHLIIIGEGPEMPKVRQLTKEYSWIHILGAKFGSEKAELLAISDVFLLPGSVGLAILDAFASSLPLATTRLSTHGPEIEYLEDGRNGLITDHEPAQFAEKVSFLLNNPELLKKFKLEAARSSEIYSLDNMVDNFRSGILSCLRGVRFAKTDASVVGS